eukprot:450829_1
MAWNPQQEQQQNHRNTNININQPSPMNQNINPHQQQFPMYPPYPINPPPNMPMYNQSYPMQSPYPPNPSPYNNTNSLQPYYGLQPMQSHQIISPFQQQSNMNNLNNTQPLPLQQKFNFNSNTPNNFNMNMNMNMMSQTQPVYTPSQLKQQQEQPLKQQELIEEEKYNNKIENNIIDEEKPKSRLEYSKMSLKGPTQLWILNNKDKIDINNQLIEEQKIFGDIKIVYNEMKQNNSVQINGNTEKQNCRLLLQYKSKINKNNNNCVDDEKELQPLLVYDYNIRPYYEPFNEYNRYKLLRFPPISNHPINPIITITLCIYSVQFKDL